MPHYWLNGYSLVNYFGQQIALVARYCLLLIDEASTTNSSVYVYPSTLWDIKLLRYSTGYNIFC